MSEQVKKETGKTVDLTAGYKASQTSVTRDTAQAREDAATAKFIAAMPMRIRMLMI